MLLMKNILIIGGSTGIGFALTKQLSQDNQVFATYAKHETASSENINFHYLNVLDEHLDLSFLPETLDGLVYCPGAINLKPFARLKTDDFLQDYQLQVLGAIKVIQQVVSKLKQSPNASIVLFSTVAVQTGFNFHTLVSTSKGAIEGLTKALAAEYAPKIRINCIAPSITDTPLAGNILNTPEKKRSQCAATSFEKSWRSGRHCQFSSIFISEKSNWITGQIFHIDGGISSLRV